RAEALRFFGGFLAFPGGRVHASDSAFAPSVDARRACAARELFEETGVLIARDRNGSFPPPDPELAHLRRELSEDRVAFPDLLAGLGLALHAADFTPVGQLVTPPFTAVRFDTTFYVAHLPPGQEPTVEPGEL